MKFSLINYRVLAFCAVSVFVSFNPNNAQAQVGPCPFGGPSPGYRVVGQTPAGNGVASILLCEPTDQRQNQPSQQPAPQQRAATFATPSYYAFAYHENAKHVWSAQSFPTEEEAKTIVMANCTKIMNNGCVLGYSGTNQSTTIFEVTDGGLAWVHSASPYDTQRVLNDCKIKTKGKECRKIYTFGAYDLYAEAGVTPRFTRSIVNAGTALEIRRKFGSVALNAEGNKIWASTGHLSPAEAETAALALCAKSMASDPSSCKTGLTIATGVIRVWLNEKKQVSFDSAFAPASATDINDKNCDKKDLATCKPKFVFEVQKTGMFEKDVL